MGFFSCRLKTDAEFSNPPLCQAAQWRDCWKDPSMCFMRKPAFRYIHKAKKCNPIVPLSLLHLGEWKRGGVAGEQSTGCAPLGWRSHWPWSTRTNVILSRTSVHSLGLPLQSTRKWGRPENNRGIISCISGDLKSEIEMLVGLVLPREGASCPSLCSWWSLAISVLHWLIDVSPPCLSQLHMVVFPLCVSVWPSLFFFF